jgi:nucleotide-binding universal stress UspA family protein
MKTLSLKRIMVPLDFTETSLMALDHAAHMASLFNSELYLIHVIELYEYTFNLYEPLVNFDPGEMESSVQKSLNAQVDRITKMYNIPVLPILTRGRVSAGITENAIDRKIDLIIMGTHGAKGFSEFFVGTNAHRTVSLAPCPVITLQTGLTHQGFSTIVMPIDETLHSRQKVDSVIYLAEKYNSTVHLLGLLQGGDDSDDARFAIKLESVEKVLTQRNVPFIKKIVKGRNLATEAIRYASDIKADLIAIMTDHESDLTGGFLGGFAKQIVNHSPVPILSIRPMEGIIETSFGGGGYV